MEEGAGAGSGDTGVSKMLPPHKRGVLSPDRPGGEVVDDDDVVILCQGVGKVRADEAGPAGDDVAHEEFMAVGRFRGF